MVKAKALFNQGHQATQIDIDPKVNNVTYNNRTYPAHEINWQVPVSGTIYGTALNYKGELEALGPRLNEEPYKAPPQAPVLYIKPVNTFNAHNNVVPLPAGVAELQAGAALAVVFKQTATRVQAKAALQYVEGYTIVNDISIPHDSLHRPAIKQKARDGFCPIGPWVAQRDAVPDPDQLDIRVYVNDVLKQTNSTRNLIRNIPQLIEEVTEFMTLYAGDVLLVGTPENPPVLTAGDRVRVEIERIGMLENTVVPEEELQ